MKTDKLKTKRKKLYDVLIIITLVIAAVLIAVSIIVLNKQQGKESQDSSQQIDQKITISQQDYQRQVDISSLASQITSHSSNNRGNLPNKTQVSEMAGTLDLVSGITNDTNPTTDQAAYVPGKDCDGNLSSRKFSVSILLSDGKVYCQQP